MDVNSWRCGHGLWCFAQSKWWTNILFVVILLISSMKQVCCDDYHVSRNDHGIRYYEAIVNVSYKSNGEGLGLSKIMDGRYGPYGLADPVTGQVFLVRSKNNETNGCTDYDMKIPTVQWIALIRRGKCLFGEKINRAAKKYNASAVVIYNNQSERSSLLLMHQREEDRDVISVAIDMNDGESIVKWLETGTVHMTINLGEAKLVAGTPVQSNISKTSVLFVSISFIVLMIISLAWLVFYYIQRFRYAHAKERLARRLASAAKKAIAKIPQRNIKSGDKELENDFDQCAICIEGYKAHDVIRSLPCKHVFHKSCVDPWLLEQRSCPMCKLDILRAYGMQVGGSEDCVHQDGESGAVSVPAEEVEQTSIAEEQGAEGQVKVLLLPHNCIHFHHEGESSLDSQTEDELVGAEHVSDFEFTETQYLMEDNIDSERLTKLPVSTA
ncbi:RING finger protein 150 [Patella vulgata]|uniref:RING finger protein 150 n=1 Tax=Patella vulgata TaxID=6465 RepID=UPI00217F5368|nr:RING finger protein 150 [Patella vulgata]